jgi:hypothetical protein
MRQDASSAPPPTSRSTGYAPRKAGTESCISPEYCVESSKGIQVFPHTRILARIIAASRATERVQYPGGRGTGSGDPRQEAHEVRGRLMQSALVDHVAAELLQRLLRTSRRLLSRPGMSSEGPKQWLRVAHGMACTPARPSTRRILAYQTVAGQAVQRDTFDGHRQLAGYGICVLAYPYVR